VSSLSATVQEQDRRRGGIARRMSGEGKSTTALKGDDCHGRRSAANPK